ncbi:MAG: hypothetical protein AAB652_02370 [Patescibacteria group bacterium]
MSKTSDITDEKRTSLSTIIASRRAYLEELKESGDSFMLAVSTPHAVTSASVLRVVSVDEHKAVLEVVVPLEWVRVGSS